MAACGCLARTVQNACRETNFRQKQLSLFKVTFLYILSLQNTVVMSLACPSGAESKSEVFLDSWFGFSLFVLLGEGFLCLFLVLLFPNESFSEIKRFLESRDKLDEVSWHRYSERFVNLEFQPCICNSGHHF